jgi:hypothetical protein
VTFSPRRKITLFTLLLCCLSAQAVRADHPTLGFGPELAGPIITVSAVPLEKGRIAFDLRTELINQKAFSDTDLIRFAEADRDVHSVDWVLSPSLGLAWGAGENLTLGLRLPYLYRNAIREAHHEPGGEPPHVEDHGDAKGFGDLTFFGQYRFLERPAAKLHLALLFGVKAPTGRTDIRTHEGGRFEAEHQPGSGSWDPMLGLALTRHFNSLAFDASTLYLLATKGTQKTDLGDLLTYSAALSWRVPELGHYHNNGGHHSHLNWDLILEANGEYRQKEEVGRVKNPESGGHILFLSPGTRLSAEDGMSAALSLGIPVWEDLNGKQSEPEYRLLFSVGAVF